MVVINPEESESDSDTRGLSELSGPSDCPVRSELSESDSDSDKNYPSVSESITTRTVSPSTYLDITLPLYRVTKRAICHLKDLLKIFNFVCFKLFFKIK